MGALTTFFLILVFLRVSTYFSKLFGAPDGVTSLLSQNLTIVHFGWPVLAFTDNVGCIVRNTKTQELTCTGMPPDHSTNTGNTILRVCSNDIGFTEPPKGQQQMNVYILTATATHLGVTEVTDRASEQFHTLEFPQTWISAPSYDIFPGETLDVIEIDGTGGNGRTKPLGLVLVSNAYRGPDKTGAATAESETIILTNGPQDLPLEVTPDELAFPVAEAFEGPDVCAVWEDTSTCTTSRSGESNAREPLLDTKHMFLGRHVTTMQRGESSETVLSDKGGDDIETRGALDTVLFDSRQDESDKCPEIEVPRSKVLRVPGSESVQAENVQASTTAPSTILVNVTTPPSNVTSVEPAANVSLTLQPTVSPPTKSPSASPVATTLAPSKLPTVTTQPPSQVPTATTQFPSLLPTATTQPPSPQPTTLTITVAPAPAPAPVPLTNTSRPTGAIATAVVMPHETWESATFFTSGAPFTSVSVPLGLGIFVFPIFAFLNWLG